MEYPLVAEKLQRPNISVKRSLALALVLIQGFQGVV